MTQPTKPTFIHLNCHSTYSLLQGMMPLKKLAGLAVKHKMPALGVTDINNMFGAVEMAQRFPDEGVQPLFGVQIGLRRPDQQGFLKDAKRITLMVQNEQGWRNILQIVSKAYLEKDPAENPYTTLDILRTYHKGLLAFTGGAENSPLLELVRLGQVKQAHGLVQELAQVFDNRLYIELQRHGLASEALLEPHLIEWAQADGLPMLATNDARFEKAEQLEPFEVMLAIGDGSTMSNPDRPRTNTHFRFKSQEEMAALFADLPEALEQTLVVAQRCGFVVPTGTNFMPRWPVQEGDPPVEDIMRKQAEEGLEERLREFVFPTAKDDAEKEALRKEYTERLAFEIKTINQMGYPGYFLITSDFIKWSKENDIPVGPGRGSGAGSLVAWCMAITDVDPIRWDLYFERFLNPERVSLPDFDIDFCPEGRDRVIAYVRDKYGVENVSQIITFGTLKARAGIRDVGRVLEMSFNQVGQIAGHIPEGPAAIPLPQALVEDEALRQKYDDDEDVRQLLDIAMELEGAYRHASTHAAGIHIADRPIADIAPLYKDPRSEMQVTAFDWGKSEAIGLVKFDFLGLKTLTVIKYIVRDIKKNHGLTIDPLKLPFDDEKTLDLLKAGHTIGVFQVESRGMTELLKKIVPDRFQYLSDVIALYRPGPLSSGMVDDFVEIRHGRMETKYPHPALKPVLEETFGVPVYQEQIMRMAQVMAGYTLGGADMLRRAMGKKKPEEMAMQKSIFVEGCAKEHNLSEEEALKIFDLMEGFAAYGFNKAHTLAYALVAWQTAYFKANYPLEFMAASMTLDRGSSEKVLKFKAELARMKVEILPPSVNHSDVFFTVEAQAGGTDKQGIAHVNGAIRFALGAIKAVGDDAMRAMIEERETNGAYKDIFDFIERQNPQNMNKRVLEALIKAGALDDLQPNRAMLLHNVDVLQGLMQTAFEDKNSDQIGLFGLGGSDEQKVVLERPQLVPHRYWDQFEKLGMEQAAFGFFFSDHPLSAYREELKEIEGICPIMDVETRASLSGTGLKLAGIIAAKRVRKTKTGNRMAILTFSDESGQDEVAVFPEAYETYADLIDKNVPLLTHVIASTDGERLRISVERMESLEDAMKEPQEMDIRLPSPNAAKVLQPMLNGLEKGRTRFVFHVRVPHHGVVQMKLPQTVKVTKPFLARVEALQNDI